MALGQIDFTYFDPDRIARELSKLPHEDQIKILIDACKAGKERMAGISEAVERLEGKVDGLVQDYERLVGANARLREQRDALLYGLESYLSGGRKAAAVILVEQLHDEISAEKGGER